MWQESQNIKTSLLALILLLFSVGGPAVSMGMSTTPVEVTQTLLGLGIILVGVILVILRGRIKPPGDDPSPLGDQTALDPC